MHSHAARGNGSSESQVDVINLVSDDDRTPVRRPRPVRASDELEIVRENLLYTESATNASGRRARRNRTPLGDLDGNHEVVVANFEDGTTEKDVCLTQHVERGPAQVLFKVLLRNLRDPGVGVQKLAHASLGAIVGDAHELAVKRTM
ncbi:hypothetical protein FGB62_29g04 [Gracilaria domingensis]|nr:hypothetical protein FGB62_29g04 [Gracilaria domingensis]